MSNKKAAKAAYDPDGGPVLEQKLMGDADIELRVSESKANRVEVPNGFGYSEYDRRLAAFLYILYGSYAMVARKMGLPEKGGKQTIHNWAQKGWWDELVHAYRQERQDELDSGFSQIVHNATTAILERVANGEEVVDIKTGKRMRRELSARDLAMVLGVVFDKRQIVRNAPTSISGKTEQDLTKFAEDLQKATAASIAKKKDNERRKAASDLLKEVEYTRRQAEGEE